jgi:hypothetical protein
MRRQGAGNTKAHQAVSALDCFFDESGGSFPISGADHNRESGSPRNLRFSGETGGTEHGRQSAHPHLPT